MSYTQTLRIAQGLRREYGSKRAQAIAWEMYNAAAMTRGELYRVLRMIKNI